MSEFNILAAPRDWSSSVYSSVWDCVAHHFAVSVDDYAAGEQEWLSSGFVPLGVVDAKSEDEKITIPIRAQQVREDWVEIGCSLII